MLRVDPAEGTELREGATVTIVPSAGPPPVPVPSVTGMTLDKAAATLDGAGLTRGDVTQIFDDKVPEGSVVRQSPAEGKAPTGSAVDLWVSKGHAPVPVPAVVGKPQDKAERLLKDAGFTPVVQVAFSNDIPRGQVISVAPAEATKTAFGSPVTLVVSQGPETFPAPVLTGLTPSQARAKAADYGLKVSIQTVPGTSGTVIISQVPAAGTTVRAGDTITVWAAA